MADLQSKIMDDAGGHRCSSRMQAVPARLRAP